jgi:hypothetical protein
LSRLEKDQSGIELMNSVKGEFVNLSEELTDDAVSIEDIDEVLQTLERATSSETEIEEPLIEESSSVVESDESMSEEVELDLSAGEMDKTSDPIRVYMREMGVLKKQSHARQSLSLNSSASATNSLPVRSTSAT